MSLTSSLQASSIIVPIQRAFDAKYIEPEVKYSSDCKTMEIKLTLELTYIGVNFTTGSQGFRPVKGDKRLLVKEFKLYDGNKDKIEIKLTDKWTRQGSSNPIEKVSNTFIISASTFSRTFEGMSTSLNKNNFASTYYLANKPVGDDGKPIDLNNFIDTRYNTLETNSGSGKLSSKFEIVNRLLPSKFFAISTRNTMKNAANVKFPSNNILFEKITKEKLIDSNPFYNQFYCFEPSQNELYKYDEEGKFYGQVTYDTNTWQPINMVSLIKDLARVGKSLGVNVYMISNHSIDFSGYNTVANSEFGYIGDIKRALNNNGKPFLSDDKLDEIYKLSENPTLEDLLNYKKKEEIVLAWDDFLNARMNSFTDEYFKDLIEYKNVFRLIAQEVAAPVPGVNNNDRRKNRHIEYRNELNDKIPKYPTPLLNIFENDLTKIRDLKLERGGFGTGLVFLVGFLSRIDVEIYFDFDSDKISTKRAFKNKNSEEIKRIAKYLYDTPGITMVEIQGHTSTDGPDSDNENLSKRRADKVLSALISCAPYGKTGTPPPPPSGKSWVTSSRFTTKGYGETKPEFDDWRGEIEFDKLLKRQKNRRVVFVIKQKSNCG